MKTMRKNAWLTGASLAAIMAVASCSKSGEEAASPEPYTPMTYARGAAAGNVVEKSIGPAGGTLTTADGQVGLTIPAGAVASATNFSIQPVSNTAPAGAGPSYRLEPANITFSKPVTVTLGYQETHVEGMSQDMLDIAFQDNSGTWTALNKTTRDTSNNTVTVQTTSLNDCTITGYYQLQSDKTILTAGGTARVTIVQVSTSQRDTAGKIVLGSATPFTREESIEKWEQTGPGTIDASTKTSAVVTIPTNVAEGSISTIEAIIKIGNTPPHWKNKTVKLRRSYFIGATHGEQFMAGHYDGQPFTCIGVTTLTANGITTIQGVTADGKSILIYVNGTDIGDYPYGNPTHAGKSEIRCNITGPVFETNYVECGTPGTKYSNGHIRITAYQEGRAYAGQFETALYDDSDCTLKTKVIAGSFNVRS